jgi:hypothetical protein
LALFPNSFERNGEFMLEIDKAKKDMALVLEGIGALFFVLGVGWLYAGNKVRGGLLLAGTLLFSAPAMGSIIIGTGGLGFCCCALPAYLLALIDIMALRRWLEKPVIEDFWGLFKKGIVLFVIWLIFMIIALVMLVPSLPNLIDFMQNGFQR